MEKVRAVKIRDFVPSVEVGTNTQALPSARASEVILDCAIRQLEITESLLIWGVLEGSGAITEGATKK
jgi:hypothetical protein